MAQVQAGLMPLIVIQPIVMLLSGLMCHAAARGRLGRNVITGYRFRELLASDRAWAAGHAAAEQPSWVGFGLTTAFAIYGVAIRPVALVAEVVAFAACLAWAIRAAIAAAANTR